MSLLQDLSNKYSSEDYLYGAFMEIDGEISGTIIIIVPEHSLSAIIKRYGVGIVDSLKKFSQDYFEELRKILNWNATVKRIDISYDTMISMMNYILSETRNDQEIFMMSYEFLSPTLENYGDMLFLPTKNSLRLLKRGL